MGAPRRQLLRRERQQRSARWAQSEPFWTNPQRRVFNSPFRVTVAWGANGVGKSQVLAGLCNKGLKGALPWQEPRPQTVILAGNTWAQIGSTVGYLWQWVDRRWFRKTLEFKAGGLHGQKLQVFDIVDGPMRGGQLRLGTFRAQNLAGPRADVVISDEPLPEAVYNELWPRLLGRGGRLYMGFTVTLGTAGKVDYIWEKVDDPELPYIGEINIPLTLDAVTPRGSKVAEIPWMTQAEIDQFEKGLSRLEVEMRMGRSRRPAVGTNYFSSWGEHLVRDGLPPVGARLGVGIDHGSRPGKQRAVLVAVSGFDLTARVWVLAEYKSAGRSTEREDAAGIIAMLASRGVQVKDVDQWVGDRAHHGDRRGGFRSNLRLMRALAQELGIDTRKRGWEDALPRGLRSMSVPYKYFGSQWDGAEELHRLMVGEAPRIQFHPDTVHTQHDLREWKGSEAADEKDGIDALRYIVVPMKDGKTR